MKNFVLIMFLISNLIFSNDSFAKRGSRNRGRVIKIYKENDIMPFLVFGTAFGFYMVMQKNADEGNVVVVQKRFSF